jgi:periplasmic protein TonB
MNSDEGALQQKLVSAPRALEDEDPKAWSTRELLRLVVPSAIATVLFIGGVYLVRLDVPTGMAGQDSPSIVQVHLLPRPNPLPVPLAPATQPATANAFSRTSTVADSAADTLDGSHADEPDHSLTPSPAAAENYSPTSVSRTLQSSAITQFRELLLHHIANYQRYPKAAQRDRLQGTVDTVFSMSRDGRLLGVWIKTSSGAAVLDQAAIDTIRQAQPLPAIPAALPDPLRIEVALGFDPS